jgi:hypothetical protein
VGTDFLRRVRWSPPETGFGESHWGIATIFEEEQIEIITLEYRDERFQFAVQEQTEDSFRGRFQWTDSQKALLLAMMEKEENDEGQPWYLDDEGYRLDDDELFKASPWTITSTSEPKKVVQRFLDSHSGEAWFCTTPWFRIGDEFNRRPS